jgi:hypothetical protein
MDIYEARRCVLACAIYLAEKDESPRAAKDLIQAVKVIEQAAENKNLAIRRKLTAW